MTLCSQLFCRRTERTVPINPHQPPLGQFSTTASNCTAHCGKETVPQESHLAAVYQSPSTKRPVGIKGALCSSAGTLLEQANGFASVSRLQIQALRTTRKFPKVTSSPCFILHWQLHASTYSFVNRGVFCTLIGSPSIYVQGMAWDYITIYTHKHILLISIDFLLVTDLQFTSYKMDKSTIPYITESSILLQCCLALLVGYITLVAPLQHWRSKLHTINMSCQTTFERRGKPCK